MTEGRFPKNLYIQSNPNILGGLMDKKLDEFINGSIKIRGENKSKVSKKKRLKSTKLDRFLPDEHINYFKALRMGSKRIQRIKIVEIRDD